MGVYTTGGSGSLMRALSLTAVLAVASEPTHQAVTRRSFNRALRSVKSSEEPTISALPLITRLQHEHANLQPVHPQRGRHSRRLVDASGGTTLTRGNTAPIRIKVDANSLVSQRAPPHSACFTKDDWFRRGLPDNQPDAPPDGTLPTCVRGEGEGLSTAGCWGRCADRDIITPADASKIEEVVTEIISEISSLLAVRPVDELSFQVSQGQYARALQAKGYPTPSSCAADCRTLSGVAVDEAYCGTGGAGHNYDVILSVTKPPGIQGVAGTGSSCASDQAGRPLWIVLAWHSSIVGVANEDTADLVKRHRGFVIHEILHGLGFVNSMFNYARDASGQRKGLIELKPVWDTPASQSSGSAPTDEVWHFVKGRAYELAQSYFNCHANSTGEGSGGGEWWDGLPLMGLPEAGRGAHFETRIMRDDVMSYGFHSHVSSITLAVHQAWIDPKGALWSPARAPHEPARAPHEPSSILWSPPEALQHSVEPRTSPPEASGVLRRPKGTVDDDD